MEYAQTLGNDPIIYPVISTGLVNVTVSSVFDPSHGADRIILNKKDSREGVHAWCAANSN